MIVCHCTGATDRQIRALVRAGASTSRALARSCAVGKMGPAGTACGGCALEIARILRDESKSNEPLLTELSPATA